jgi:hypothetical protein
MVTEIETLYTRLDEIHMTPADRHLAKARLAQAEALADLLHGAIAGLARVIGARSAPVPHSPDLRARGSN